MDVNNRTRQWLNAQHISVPPEWLDACVDFLHDEHRIQGQAIPENNIRQLVLEQWLVTDLKDLKCGSLPSGLCQMHTNTLTGSHALQVESFMDVSKPAYSQLQQLCGKANENALIDESKPTQTNWEPQSGRMLMMDITDGVQLLKAMEYKPISALTPDLPPGTKVMVQGPLLVKLGTLLLKPENIRVLGGEVDALLQTHSRIALLSQAVGEEFPVEAIVQSQDDIAVLGTAEESMGAQTAVARSTTGSICSESLPPQLRGPIDDDHLLEMMDTNEPNFLQPQKYDTLMEDDDIDDELLMEHLDFQGQAAHSNSSGTHLSGLSSTRDHDGHHSAAHVQGADKARYTTSPADHCATHENPSDGRHPSAQPGSVGGRGDGSRVSWPQNLENGGVDCQQSNPNSCKHGVSTVAQGAQATKSDSAQLRHSPINSAFCTALGGHISAAGDSSPHTNQATTHGSMPDSAIDITDEELCRVDDDFEDFAPARKIGRIGHHGDTLQETRCKSTAVGAVSGINCSSGQKKVPPTLCPGLPNTRNVSPDTLSFRQGFAKVEHPEQSFSHVDSLQNMLANSTWSSAVIRGFVSTLTSKLENDKGKLWKLTARLSDGTSSLNVDLGDELLTSLIGFSASQCNEMKARVKHDPAIKDRILSALADCQVKLANLYGVLDIQMQSSHQRPVLVSCRCLTEHDVEEIPTHLEVCKTMDPVPYPELCGADRSKAIGALDCLPFSSLDKVKILLPHITGKRVKFKGFIAAITSEINSGGQSWAMQATVSDGTAYLEVELCDHYVSALLGFTAAESKMVNATDMQQAGSSLRSHLYNLYGVFSVNVEANQQRPIVTSCRPVTQDDLHQLRQTKAR
ncbi:PREDICTED: uncharacterized protein LOC106814612 isoform X2 [Priapulus caudatus]|nr:PREDICTED: uncharacterized protein LOC106814612 isoform X2 [Priapulus caudatus]